MRTPSTTVQLVRRIDCDPCERVDIPDRNARQTLSNDPRAKTVYIREVAISLTADLGAPVDAAGLKVELMLHNARKDGSPSGLHNRQRYRELRDWWPAWLTEAVADLRRDLAPRL